MPKKTKGYDFYGPKYPFPGGKVPGGSALPHKARTEYKASRVLQSLVRMSLANPNIAGKAEPEEELFHTTSEEEEEDVETDDDDDDDDDVIYAGSEDEYDQIEDEPYYERMFSGDVPMGRMPLAFTEEVQKTAEEEDLPLASVAYDRLAHFRGAPSAFRDLSLSLAYPQPGGFQLNYEPEFGHHLPLSHPLNPLNPTHGASRRIETGARMMGSLL